MPEPPLSPQHGQHHTRRSELANLVEQLAFTPPPPPVHASTRERPWRSQNSLALFTVGHAESARRAPARPARPAHLLPSPLATRTATRPGTRQTWPLALARPVDAVPHDDRPQTRRRATMTPTVLDLHSLRHAARDDRQETAHRPRALAMLVDALCRRPPCPEPSLAAAVAEL